MPRVHINFVDNETVIMAEHMNGIVADIGDLETASASAEGRLQIVEAGKVDKVTGKQLSTNDYTTAEKQKLAGIAAGAEVNVNADWNATTGDAKILNKPGNASASAPGLMSAADKAKLDTVESGAQPNPGTATASADGLMSAEDKAKLDDIVDNTLTLVGHAAEANVTGYEITSLKALVGSGTETVANGLGWSKGTISTQAGANTSSTTRIRSAYFTQENFSAIKSINGFTFCVYAYELDDTYIGNLREGYSFEKTTGSSSTPLLFVTEYTLQPQYKYRLIVKDETGSSSIVIADGANILGVVGKVDRTLTVSGQPADAQNTGRGIAYPYSNTKTYKLGDYCTYDGSLYYCAYNMDAAEEWDGSHWMYAYGGISALEETCRGIMASAAPTIGNEWLPWRHGHYTSETTSFVGETLHKSNSANYVGGLCPCSPGDVFYVTLEGGPGVSRGWFFADADMKILSGGYPTSGYSANNRKITAPANAAFFAYANDLTERQSGYYAYRGVGFATQICSDLASIEADTATANHAAGELVINNRQLYRVISPIATGETLTPGTNIVQTTVEEQIQNAVGEAIAYIDSQIAQTESDAIFALEGEQQLEGFVSSGGYVYYNYAISDSATFLRSGSTYQCWAVPRRDLWHGISITAQDSKAAQVTFFKTSPPAAADVENGDPCDDYLCEGETGRRSVTAGTTQFFPIPDDCQYMLVYKKSSTTDLTPSKVMAASNVMTMIKLMSQ